VTAQTLEQVTLRKVAWKLVPFLCLLYVFNILDRANLGFARLGMQDDLDMSQEMFDLGYGLFYIGYLLFEVPSNLLLRRVGARRWIARIMISWGLISCLTMFVYDVASFYAIRILLGVAEAGFFPGIILYLSYWFPDRERAKMTAYFMMAIALASVFGNPLSGLIMHYLDGAWNLYAWQWLFLLEGIPSILLGTVVFFKLVDGPAQAEWLAPDERNWLVERMQREERDRQETHGADRLGALLDWRVWLLIAIYSTVAVGSNAGGAYFPTLIKDRFGSWNTLQIGLLSALPHLCAAIGMVLFSASSDRIGKRREHWRSPRSWRPAAGP
jgi:ACS family tartrate transporter-like MFS transporter